MSAKRIIVRGADKNCRSKDPSTCRYHGEAFVPLTKPSEIVGQIFEQVNKDMSPSMVISSSLSEEVEQIWDRKFFEEESLSDQQRYALHRYSDEYGSNQIRSVLMNPEKRYVFNGVSMEDLHSQIKELDGLLEEHSVDVSDTTLWRGVKEFKYELSEVQEGATVTNLSYTPTTLDPEIAVSFSTKSSPILLKVKAKSGYQVGGQYVAEKEVLLRRGLSFKVVSILENVHLKKQNARFGDDGYVRGITLVELEEI